MKFNLLIKIGLFSTALVFTTACKDKSVSYNHDIRPILNKTCMGCHGGVRQKGGVSFLYREDALGVGKSGHATIVPGKPEHSELIKRLTSNDPDERMPYNAPPLKPEKIELIRAWIKQGAAWEEHWAFVKPVLPELPKVKQLGWIQNTIDQFILARLESENLKPAPEANKTALLRRVSFDLTGLPPTQDEIKSFMVDTSEHAYEKQVDRLLNSVHYGERWASLWLDLARYADSAGYEKDEDRPMWPYRDWVINAFNNNLPYNEFVIKQLAGDLLPDAKFSDYIASAFHRQTPTNAEGGIDPEEYRIIAVMDRVATTWSALNGLTINCVQCHSHPYDPIRHDEYYKFMAFFNTQADANYYSSSPMLQVPEEPSQYELADKLQKKLNQLSKYVINAGKRLESISQWESLPISHAKADAVSALQHIIKQEKIKSKPNQSWIKKLKDKIKKAKANQSSVQISYKNGSAILTGTVPSELVLTADVAIKTDTPLTAIRIEAWPEDPAKAKHTPENGFIVDAIKARVVTADGKTSLVEFDHYAQDTTLNILLNNEHMGVFSANPKLAQTRWVVAILKSPLMITAGSTLKIELLHTETISYKSAVVPRLRLSSSHDAHWTNLINDPKTKLQLAEINKIKDQLDNIKSTKLPIMVELNDDHHRETRLFRRGNFLEKIGTTLKPDTPALFPALPTENQATNRLVMAKWFFQADQPLTARVAVNRYWEQLFGTGIVETLEDFGSAGELPSHPELLDWLALYFQNDLQWDMKALLKTLVTSSTYRQDASINNNLLSKDPKNRLLARGPRLRLTAEMVRDQALLASGLLTNKIGGPAVMPPQPEGVWNTVYSYIEWVDATNEDRYRRALYTYIRRSAVYPSFLTFDASSRTVSLARRIPTNTPLQALVMMNDPVYIEASVALARQLRETASNIDVQLATGIERVLSRPASPYEVDQLKAFYQKALNEPDALTAEMVPATQNINQTVDQQLLALSATTSIIFNFDAALTR